MVAAHSSPLSHSRFSSSTISSFFVVHRTNYARLLSITRTRRKHALAVYTVLSAHADGTSGETCLAYGTIAREAGMARSTAIEAVRTLAEYDLLTIEERHDPQGDRATNRYTLHVVPAVAAAHRGSRETEPGVVRPAVSIENPPEQESSLRAMPVDSTLPPLVKC